jgi:uncharacterized RDD family membrane protein YckC
MSEDSVAPRRRFEYVGFWKRLFASIIDTLVVLVVLTPLMLLVHRGDDWKRLAQTVQESMQQAASGTPPDVAAGMQGSGFSGPADFLIQVLLPIAGVLLFWKFRNATPGKMAIHARIVDAKSGGNPSGGQLLVRFLGYFLSTLPLGLGFLWIAFDRRKQGFHDKIAGTAVVYED